MLTEKQLAARKNGIGASESAIVLGVNPYCSPYELWLLKTGQKQPDDLSNNMMVHWGNIHEETIAQEYARVSGCEVEVVPETLFHPEHPYMLCHLDRKVVGRRKILECKFASAFSREWGEAGTDEIPLHYIVQVQHQLAITGYEEADLAVLIGGCDFRIYPIKRDEEIIQKIINEVSNFWNNNVLNNIAPDLLNRNDASLCFPIDSGDAVPADTDAVQLVNRIRLIREAIKTQENEKAKYEDKITLILKDASALSYEGKAIATWKANKNGSRVLRIA